MVDAGALRGGDVALQLHGMRIAEFEPPHRLGDDDRRFAVRREIDVVGVGHVHHFADLARLRIDGRDAPVAAARAHVRPDPKSLQIPGRDDVLGNSASPSGCR